MLAAAAVAVTTQEASGATSERGYELVSPAQKEKGSVLWGAGGLPAVSANAATDRGEEVLFASYQPFPNSTHGQPSSFLATRTDAGWQTVPVSPDPATQYPALIDRTLVFDATDDFSTSIFETYDNFHPLDQDAYPIPGFFINFPDVYTAQTGSQELDWISRANADIADSALNPSIYVGRSEDVSTVYFMTANQLTPDAGLMNGGSYLYSRGPGGTRLINASGGAPLHSCGASLGAYGITFLSGATTKNAVSRDGRRAFFQVPDADAPLVSSDPSCFELARLYVNDDGQTTEISASQRTTPDPVASAATYQAATADGSRVFFTSADRLTDDATTGGGLYAYDVDARTLSFLSTGAGPSGAQVRGVVKSTDDGSHIYFLAGGELVAGRGVDGGENLYLWADGTITFIATVDGGDVGALRGIEPDRQARVTPDGSHFLFAARAELTGDALAGRRAVYLYEAADRTLTCVSCRSDGAAPTGDASLLTAASYYSAMPTPHETRNITENGSQVFFESRSAIVDEDVNEQSDVYEFADGAPRLVSDGRSVYGSLFFDASVDGRDVFFATQESLVAQDVDNGDNDVYNARIGGGFPVPPRPAPCVGDGCQAPPTAPPAFVAPPSVGQAEEPELDMPEIPALRLAKPTKKATKRFARSGKLTVVLRAGGPGKAGAVASARVKRRVTIVAQASRSISRAGTVRLTLRLSKAARRQLARNRRLNVTVQAALTGAVPQRATLSLRLPRKAAR
jgi:hypothetical protein